MSFFQCLFDEDFMIFLCVSIIDCKLHSHLSLSNDFVRQHGGYNVT